MGIHKITGHFLCFGTPLPALAIKRVPHQSCWKLDMQFAHHLLWPGQISATEYGLTLALAANLLQLLGNIIDLLKLTKREPLTVCQTHF